MKQTFIVFIAGLIILGPIGLAYEKQRWQPRSLVGASAEEIAQVALDLTRRKGTIRSGTPQVLLVRSVIAAELPMLSLGGTNFGAREALLALVILKGDFDVNNIGIGMPAAVPGQSAKYIGYLFDLESGTPSSTFTSSNEDHFIQILTNPIFSTIRPIGSIPTSTLPTAGIAPPIVLPPESDVLPLEPMPEGELPPLDVDPMPDLSIESYPAPLDSPATAYPAP